MPLKTLDKAPAAISLIVLSGASLVASCMGYALLSRNGLETAFWFVLSVWVVGSLPLTLLACSALPAVKKFRFFWVYLAGVAVSTACGFVLISFKVKSIQGAILLLMIASWICAPTTLSAWLGATFVRAKGQWLLIIGLFLLEIARLWFYWMMNLGGRPAGLIIIVVPLYQYIATALLLTAAWLINRGRAPLMSQKKI